MPSYRGEVVDGHPVFPPDSKLHPRAHDGPVPVSEPDLVYSEEDEKAIEDYVREVVRTAWHSVGRSTLIRPSVILMANFSSALAR